MTDEQFAKAVLRARARVHYAQTRLARLLSMRRRRCAYCDQEFVPSRKDQKYCRPSHRAQFNAKLREGRLQAELAEVADYFHGS